MRSKSLYVYELNWMTEESTPREQVLRLMDDALSDRMLAQIDVTVLKEKLRRLALHEDLLISGCAIQGLVQLEDWKALSQLVCILIEPRKQLKQCGYWGATHLLYVYERNPMTALVLLEFDLRSALKSVNTDELWPAIRGYFRRKDADIRRRAIEIAGELHIAAAMNSLKTIIADPEQAEFHETAIEALGHIGDERAVRYLITLLENVEQRRDAIWALQLTKSPKAVPALKKLLATSPPPAVFSSAIETLGEISGDVAARVLLQYLDGPYKTAVIEALGKAGSEVAVPRLDKLLRSRNATDAECDLAAEALSAIDTPAARKALADALAHGSHKSASSAGTALRNRQESGLW
ncbi:MAG: HEAT repeat domain-containing protein [Anaerolineae bacterium]